MNSEFIPDNHESPSGGSLLTNRYLSYLFSFLSGVGLIGVVELLRMSLAPELKISSQPILETALLIFIGVSIGYYLGRLLTGERDRTVFLAIGALTTIAALIIAFVDVLPKSALLVCTAATVFMLHLAGLVESNETVSALVHFSSVVSRLGLLLGIVAFYASPMTRVLEQYSPYPIDGAVSIVATLVFLMGSFTILALLYDSFVGEASSE